jgi:hypothetical protein
LALSCGIKSAFQAVICCCAAKIFFLSGLSHILSLGSFLLTCFCAGVHSHGGFLPGDLRQHAPVHLAHAQCCSSPTPAHNGSSHAASHSGSNLAATRSGSSYAASHSGSSLAHAHNGSSRHFHDWFAKLSPRLPPSLSRPAAPFISFREDQRALPTP